MDIQLFAAKLNRPLTAEETETFMRILPDERRERLLQVPREELRQEPLCAYAILFMAVHSLRGWKKLPRMAYNRYGKPEFAEHPDLQFNLSHTRNAVLVGLHDEPLGVDIERLRPVSERSMQRIAGAATRQEFFESWVRRESRVKWSGTGLSSIREEENTLNRGERIYFFDTFPDYVACLCTHSGARVAPLRSFIIE